MIELLLEVVMSTDDNAITKYCVAQSKYENFQTANWNQISSCAANLREIKTNLDREELRDFLKHNPRYKFPGQSLNKCFGKPREMPFEQATFSTSPYGMYAEIKYKDTLPADCFQSQPWDNRDLK